jgi:imidazolonepropionase-like amidohydrolase
VPALLDGVAAGQKMPAAVVAKLHEGRDSHLSSVRRAIEAGIKIALGSDAAAMGHGRNLNELKEMHALGLSAADTLRSTTISAATLMGREKDIGSIESGKLADITIVSGDPFAFDDYPSNVRAVFKRGRLARHFPN